MKDGGPAFPLSVATTIGASGMSLRDYFAAMAMQGMLAGSLYHDKDGTKYPSWVLPDKYTLSENAYSLADAMLSAREVQS